MFIGASHHIIFGIALTPTLVAIKAAQTKPLLERLATSTLCLFYLAALCSSTIYFCEECGDLKDFA